MFWVEVREDSRPETQMPKGGASVGADREVKERGRWKAEPLISVLISLHRSTKC